MKKLLVAVAIAASSLFEGLYEIGARSFSSNEAFYAAFARLPAGDLGSFALNRDPQAGLYALLIHVWIMIGGDGDAWLRGSSVVLGALCVLVMFLTVDRLAGLQVAVWSTVLMVTTTFFLQYQQHVGPHVLALLTSMLGVYCFVRAVERGKWCWYLLWALVASLSIYTHPYAGAVVLAEIAAALVDRKAVDVRRLLTGVMIFVVSTLPLVVIIMINRDSIARPKQMGAGDVVRSAYAISGRSGSTSFVILMSLIALFLWLAVRRSRFREPLAEPWKNAFLAAWALLLPVGVVLVAVFGPVLRIDYLLPALPAVCVIVVISAQRLGTPLMSASLLVVLVLLAVSNQRHWYKGDSSEDWRSASELVEGSSVPGDGVLIASEHRPAFDRYLARNAQLVPVSPSRPWGSKLMRAEAEPSLQTPAQVRDALALRPRMWWVYATDDPPRSAASIARGLQEIYGPPTSHDLGDRLVVRLYGAS